MCGLRLLLSVILLPLALFGAAVLCSVFLYWQGMLPAKYQGSIRAAVRTFRMELAKQERR